jgi:two-component system, NtrC family, nitrogen regulation sensor histidine kinase NtrY
MTFRTRFFTLFSLAVLAGTGLLAWGAIRRADETYARFDSQRDSTVTAQFRREFEQRGQEVSYAMQGLADAEATLRMALDLSRAQADPSLYANDARGLATAHQLDFLDLVSGDGSLISSAQWPARSGYKNDWVTSGRDWNHRSAFLQRVDLPDGVELGLLAVRVVTVGEKNIYLIGGLRFDREFLGTVSLPSGTRALLYSNLEPTFAPERLASAAGSVEQAERFAGIIDAAEKSPERSSRTIQWTGDKASTENFVAIPLAGRQNEPLAVLLVGSTQVELATLEHSILVAALVVATLGIFAGLLLSNWASARMTKPLSQVRAGMRQVTAGDWAAQVSQRSPGEGGQLALAFNEMTAQISRERARLIQGERVAAWRDVTQGLTQDMKQYLFPMELTVGDLTRARAEASPRFGAALTESVASLRTELDQLKGAVNRFSEFAKMPQPRMNPVDLNEILRGVLHTFEPQFRALGRPPITPELFLDGKVGRIQGDPYLLRKALDNLLLHAVDTMPAGGTLTVRTGETKGIVHVQISGSGAGFGTEQRSDPFMAFRARQTPGAGLGLPVTQAVVSDHGGRFFAETIPGGGTTFWLEFAVTTAVEAPPVARPETTRRETSSELPKIPAAVLETIPSGPAGPSGSATATSMPNAPPNVAPTAVPAEVPAAVSLPTGDVTTGDVVASSVELEPATRDESESELPGVPTTAVEVPPFVFSESAPAEISGTTNNAHTGPTVSAPPDGAPAAVEPSQAETLLHSAMGLEPPLLETTSELPEVPTAVLETISPAPSESAPDATLPVMRRIVSSRGRRARGLLPSLLGLELYTRESESELPEVPETEPRTTPDEAPEPPAAVPDPEPSLREE